MRNRCIAITVLVTIIIAIVHCSTKDDPVPPAEPAEPQVATAVDTLAQAIAPSDTNQNPNGLVALKGIEDEDFESSGNTANGNVASATNATAESTDSVRDTLHIKAQKDPLLADKIDILLRRYHPDLGVILVVDTKTNEIIAWGERRDGQVQNKPDYIGRATFPAASLAKLVTIAAAMESNRYSLNTPIPMIGRHHTLYLNQLRVPEKYNGPTMELSEAFARSANPPMAIVGKNVGGKRLNAAAAKLGYNKNFPGNAPNASRYTAPDTGYGLAEVACGFTTSTTLTPLLAAAQVRAILTKKPLEIPWARDMAIRPAKATRPQPWQIHRKHILRSPRIHAPFRDTGDSPQAHVHKEHGPQEFRSAPPRRQDRLSRWKRPRRTLRLVHGICRSEKRSEQVHCRHRDADAQGNAFTTGNAGSRNRHQLLGTPKPGPEKII